MPLLEIRKLNGRTRLGLWSMNETPDELKVLFPHLRGLDMPFSNVVRQKEFLCIRALLTEMTGDTSLLIGHEKSGRPTLNGWGISISHTKGYCALALSCGMKQGWMTWEPATNGADPVAVDIEQRADTVARVADRFIRHDEKAVTVDQMLVVWSAKETLYKLYSEDNLQFFDMRVHEMGTDTLMIENIKRGRLVTLHYELSDDYVLTYYPANDVQANR